VELFEIGERAYHAGEYTKAVRYMQEALRLSFSPTLVYNLARAHQKAGQLPDAIEAYQRYLEADPGASDSERVQARIKMLEAEQYEREAMRAERERTSQEEPTSTTAEPPPARVEEGLDPLPWVVTGASAAALGVGLILSALALEKHRDARGEPRQALAFQYQNEAQELALAANVTFVVGGILLGAGVVWGILDASGRESAPTKAGITPQIGLGSVSITGVFE